MGAQLRQLRRQIRSVKSTAKITRAQELIATSRIVKAQERVKDSAPYARHITRALTALISHHTHIAHPLVQEKPEGKRAAVLVITSDRGFCGGYNANVIREAEALITLLRGEGKDPIPYVVGRKGITWYRFRDRDVAEEWSGFSDKPVFADAERIGRRLVADFLTDVEEGGLGRGPQAAAAGDRGSRGGGRPRGDRAAGVRVRAVGGCRARPAAAELRREPHLAHAPAVRGLGARVAAAGDEVRDGQRERTDRALHAPGQPGAAGRDHPGNQRDRRWRQRARRG
jgi:hypothetical protein